MGVSPRASLALMRMSQAFAGISGRDYVVPDDVRLLTPFVFGHRVITASGVQTIGETKAIIEEAVRTVAVPTENWTK